MKQLAGVLAHSAVGVIELQFAYPAGGLPQVIYAMQVRVSLTS